MEYPRRPSDGFPSPRRVFTAPTSSTAAPQQPSSSSSQAGAGLVETLYNHPSAKIVSFTAGPRPVFSPGNGTASSAEVEPGSLSWSSQLERTIAVGPFRIYRAPGSVAFLSCGSALQPILPKSQCWCVDEASSKYVLQIRRPQYWRIEVPVAGDENIRNALLLREVLEKVLRFEKTECPFRRTFTVELPEPPETPVKMRPWTPVGKTFISLPPTPVTPIDMILLPKRAAAGGTRGSVDETVAQPESTPLGDPPDQVSPCNVVSVDPKEEIPETLEASTEAKEPDTAGLATLNEPEEGNTDSSTQSTTPDQATGSIPRASKSSGFQASRVITAPPRLTLRTSPPAPPTVTLPEEPIPLVEVSESNSPTESQDSFHSVESWTSPVTPLPISPPLSTDGSPTVTFAQHNLQVENSTTCQDGSPDLTLTPNTPQTWIAETNPVIDHSEDDGPSSTQPSVLDDESSNCSVSTADECIPSPSPTSEAEPLTTATSTTLTRRSFVRHRPTTSSSISPSRRRALSPLPSAANLFTPRQPFRSKDTRNISSRLDLVRRLPMTVVHKTVEILLSPPSHLITLMLRVAARIAAGQWRGYVFGTGEAGETIPVRWDWSDDDDGGCDELGGWAADEDWPYGSSPRATGRRASAWSPKMAGSFPESPSDDNDDDDEEGGARCSKGDRQPQSRDGSSCGGCGEEREPGADAAADWGRNCEVD